MLPSFLHSFICCILGDFDKDEYTRHLVSEWMKNFPWGQNSFLYNIKWLTGDPLVAAKTSQDEATSESLLWRLKTTRPHCWPCCQMKSTPHGNLHCVLLTRRDSRQPGSCHLRNNSAPTHWLLFSLLNCNFFFFPWVSINSCRVKLVLFTVQLRWKPILSVLCLQGLYGLS